MSNNNAPRREEIPMNVQQIGPAAVFEQEFDLSFDGPNRVFTFSVETDGAGTLQVDTMDCCIPGDMWGVRVIPGDPCQPIQENCGNGSITEFSGLVEATGVSSAVVEVFYCQGVDLFSAGMTVRFRYTGDTFAVTQTGSCESADKTCQTTPLSDLAFIRAAVCMENGLASALEFAVQNGDPDFLERILKLITKKEIVLELLAEEVLDGDSSP